MADSEETPAQRQARIRRQKREAKITASAQDRLDKITRLSGRTPESTTEGNESLTTNIPPPATTTTTAAATTTTTIPAAAIPTIQAGGPALSDTSDPEQVQAQEEYFRSLLRAPIPQPAPQQEQEDPMLKVLSSMLGGVDGSTGLNPPGGSPLSADDLSKVTGLPSVVTNMMLGGPQTRAPTRVEEQATRFWKVVHVVFAVVAGAYLVFTINRSTRIFGNSPPAPATFQNPFVAFATGELLVQASRIASSGASGKSGPGLWIQMLKELVGDGAIIVFMLGTACWLKGST